MQKVIAFFLGVLITFVIGRLIPDDSSENAVTSAEDRTHRGSNDQSDFRSRLISDSASLLLKNEEQREKLAEHLANGESLYYLKFLCGLAENGEVPFDAVLEFYFTLSKIDQEYYRETLYDSWIKSDPLEAYNSLLAQKADLIGGEFEHFVPLALESLAARDPERGIELLSTLSSSRMKSQFAIDLARGLADKSESTKDFEKAFEFLKSLSDHDVSSHVVNLSYVEIMERFMTKDPWAAADAISQVKTGDVQAMLLRKVTNELADSNYEKSLAWVSGLDEQTARDEGLKVISEKLTETPPDVLLEKVLDPNSNFSGEAVSHALWTLAERDPKLLAKNFDSIQGERRPEAAGRLISEWIRDDEEGVVNWLAEVEDQSIFDAGAEEMARHFYYRDPSVALEWAGQIGDDKTRRDFFDNLTTTASHENLPRLLELADTAKLPQESKDYLTQRLNKKLEDLESPLILPSLGN